MNGVELSNAFRVMPLAFSSKIVIPYVMSLATKLTYGVYGGDFNL